MDPTQHQHQDDAPTPDGQSEGVVSRRNFIKTAALLGGSGLMASSLSACAGQPVAITAPAGGPQPYLNSLPENQLYTVCMNCNTGCGIKAKIENGVVSKIDGNPFSPMTMTPHLPY